MRELTKYDEENISNLVFSTLDPIEDCEFQGLDFSGIDLKGVSFLDCRFVSCNLANQNLLNGSFRSVIFQSCNLLGVNWCNPRRVEDLQFLDSKLNLSSFQALKLKNLKAIGCSVTDVDFSGADLTESDFSNSNLSGTNFEGATLNGADFTTSRDYVFDIRTAKIKNARFGMPYVLSLITALGAKVDY